MNSMQNEKNIKNAPLTTS